MQPRLKAVVKKFKRKMSREAEEESSAAPRLICF
jgi:hypothetical protein